MIGGAPISSAPISASPIYFVDGDTEFFVFNLSINRLAIFNLKLVY